MQNTKFSTLETKVDKSDKKNIDMATLVHISQYNTDKQNLQKKIEGADKKIPYVSEFVANTILNKKLAKLRTK